MIPYGRQQIVQADIDAVVDVLRSDFLTQGPVVPQFESTVAQRVGSAYGFAVSSATAALHVACLALDLGEGDWLWTSPITFVASANCALYCGAKVDFVDIDPRTYNMSVEALEKKLEVAKKIGRLPKVVVPVHFAGQSCDMRGIRALAEVYGFKIIEDASHAIGGTYLGEPVGNCRYSDIVVFSFHPVKIITTAEGGMAMTNDPQLARRIGLLRSHGITRDRAVMTHEPDGPWYYQQVELGFNYRMTDIQAALGLSQMARLDEYVAARHSLANRYDKLLEDLAIVRPWQHPDAFSAYHLFTVRISNRPGNRSRRAVFEAMREAGVGVNVHYIPVHLQPYFSAMGFRSGDFPNAECYYSEALTLPLYPTLSTQQQDTVVSSLREVVKA
ncbi:UDP-4-amino-4,6-dideoxy-N-acetyl-beta-L-altrosamine transaminase [Rhizobium altiplani]|uniref:UDP-4-amino-4, 6-dideoxy-N-acetyl-beta-L-altrosamine transaminase n=1 Tax=Rhizobium altiplani TaxID=1864509 RepID=A0A109K2D9_9HYPH|nr:UDP-4-amino-4,6-dideoxy-N-acetyl-beta-L-altrosamine transaminase [Rhizobium altiplani]KWV59561.1 UDP-4-amino-4,6-dideoxy-N-acetyl-beta-L-altrosamine transaminase [Rhizobium altiplani]